VSQTVHSLLNPSVRAQAILTLAPGDVPAVYAGPDALSRVLVNLIRNSLQAAHPDRPLEIKLSTRAEGEHVLLSVSDTGTGIPAEYRDRIFEPRFSTKGDQGNGLGLANCVETLKRFGASLSFETETGVGTTFTIRLKAFPRDVY
jgi:signal transduction histidine kinase